MRRLVIFGCLAALAACAPSTHSYRYLSKDRSVSLVVEPDGLRAAAEGRRNAVYLLGEHSVETADGEWRISEDRALLGYFVGLWNPAAIAWVDASTVNVCPLSAGAAVPGTATVRVSQSEHRTYRITTDCAPGLRRSGGDVSLPGRS